MNAELRRNLWLELSASRMALMAGVLALILGIAWLGGGAMDNRPAAIGGAGEVLFGLIVAFWGSFKAGRSVSDEIRERTWDFQRLSALSPASMMIGKLFGATAYVWFGGAIALVAIGYGQLAAHGALAAAMEVFKLALLGVFAHAVALATSLAVVRRGRGKERVDSFLFTIAGVVAFQFANAASGGKDRMFYDQSAPEAGAPAVGVDWLGMHLTHEGWAFLVIGVLTVWAVSACWRLMRVELQAPANPLWFPLFLLAPTLLAVGRFDTLREGVTAAYFTIHALVLATVLLEPKDFVSWRALFSELRTKARGAGRYWPATLTGVIVAFLAACAVAATGLAPAGGRPNLEPLVGFAAFAFLLREVAIFVFFHLGARQRRGDFAALVTIALLCVAGPAILNLLHLNSLSSAFFVQPDGGAPAHLHSIAAGLVEAAIFGVLAQARWRARERGLETA